MLQAKNFSPDVPTLLSCMNWSGMLAYWEELFGERRWMSGINPTGLAKSGSVAS